MQRRVKRIYPTFLAVLGCYLVLSVLFPSESKIPGHTWPAAKYILENVLFLPGIFHIVPIITVAWSLSFEFAFYLFVPFMALILSRHQDKRQRIALLSLIWVLFSAAEAFLFHATHIRMLSFVSGMLLQEVTAGQKVRSLVGRRGQWISIGALAVTASYHFAVQPKYPAGPLGTVASVLLMSAAIFSFVLHALEYPGFLQKVCTWRPMRYWGNISYSYYLAHGITLKALATLLASVRPPLNSVLMFCIALGAGLAATWVSASLLYLLVEKPLSLAPKRQHISTGVAVLGSAPWWLRKGRPAAETAGNP
jgi:peptidoglycan/LPS O-acetylase OafA/YrhL